MFREETEFHYRDLGFTFIIKHVPAFICPICGQKFFDEDVKSELERVFEQTCCEDDSVVIRSYVAWGGWCSSTC